MEEEAVFVPPSQADPLDAEETRSSVARSAATGYRAATRLAGRVALVTGGDAGLGRAIAVAFAQSGADVAISWLDDRAAAADTLAAIEAEGARGLSIPGDIGNPDFCRELARQVVAEFGRVDVLVNNAAEQHVEPDFEQITDAQVERTFRTNIFGLFYLTRDCLPHMASGSCVINTASVAAYQGCPDQIDYASSKGAVVSFTRSLAAALVKRGIRVNAVSPGLVWTPPVAAAMPPEGDGVPMGRQGLPEEIAASYVFLASGDASYMTGQVLHPNGGRIVNG